MKEIRKKKQMNSALLLNFCKTYYKSFLSDFEKRHKDNRILCAFPFFKDQWHGRLGLSLW